MDPDKPRSDGQTIARAVAILQVLAERPGASFGQIAKATGLPRSTVQRLVGVLNHEGLVTKAFGQQGAYLGMELARLGAKVRLDARALLRPFLESLHARIGDNIDLTMLEGGRVFVIEQIASNEAIRVISHVGKEHPIHCTANGKAHLAALPRDAALALLQGPLPRLTPRTRTTAEEVMADIDAARVDGVFTDVEEYSEGACAMAVPLPKIGETELAISIAMPSNRFERLKEDMRDALLETRDTVIAEYGRSI
ncbi:MAG: IclR family transcriptional regulator [Pararhodobacter sp.]